MNDTNTSGEFFVDDAREEIPRRETWGDLSVKELYGVKTQLENKLLDFYQKPEIERVLSRSISDLELLIIASQSAEF